MSRQTASYWLLEYGEASRAELEREVESLRERALAEQSEERADVRERVQPVG